MNAGLFIFYELTLATLLIFFIKVKKHSEAYTGEGGYHRDKPSPPSPGHIQVLHLQSYSVCCDLYSHEKTIPYFFLPRPQTKV